MLDEEAVHHSDLSSSCSSLFLSVSLRLRYLGETTRARPGAAGDWPPLHHLQGPGVHPHRLPLLGHGVKEDVLPELGRVPEVGPVLGEDALGEGGVAAGSGVLHLEEITPSTLRARTPGGHHGAAVVTEAGGQLAFHLEEEEGVVVEAVWWCHRPLLRARAGGGFGQTPAFQVVVRDSAGGRRR